MLHAEYNQDMSLYVNKKAAHKCQSLQEYALCREKFIKRLWQKYGMYNTLRGFMSVVGMTKQFKRHRRQSKNTLILFSHKIKLYFSIASSGVTARGLEKFTVVCVA